MPPTKDTVLDLQIRRTIVDTVREHPGIHLRALANLMQVPLSTLEYHCYQLERHGHLTSRQDAGFKALYPAEGLDRRDKDVLVLVRHEAPRRICAHLVTSPGATPKALKDVTGLAGPTLSFHLKRLRKGNLTREEPDGRTKRIFLQDPERVANVLVTYRRSFLDDAIDRFADAWLALGAVSSDDDGGDASDLAANDAPGAGANPAPDPMAAPTAPRAGQAARPQSGEAVKAPPPNAVDPRSRDTKPAPPATTQRPRDGANEQLRGVAPPMPDATRGPRQDGGKKQSGPPAGGAAAPPPTPGAGAMVTQGAPADADPRRRPRPGP